MHNENRSRSTQSTATSVTNLNVQDTEGVTVVGDGNYVTATDYGAIDAARDFANSALDVGVEALRMGDSYLSTSANLAGRGLDTAIDATRGALDFSASSVLANERIASESMSRIADFGGAAIGEVGGISRAAFAELSDAQSGVLDFASSIFDRAISAQSDLTDANLTGLGSLAKQTSASADDRVTNVAMYAFIAIVAVFALPALLKGMSA